MLTNLIDKMLGMKTLDKYYRRAADRRENRSIFQELTQEFDFRTLVSPAELKRIPGDGPLIIVANHPTGFAEGLYLPALIDSIRPDQKVLAHTWFRRWPELAERMVLLNPQAKGENCKDNCRAVREAARWIRLGNSLTLFPAGEVAGRRAGNGDVTDSEWKAGLVHLMRLTRASVLPVHVSGHNSFLFYLLSRIHPRLAALRLVRELFRHQGGGFRIRVGQPVTHDELQASSSQQAMVENLRRTVEKLAEPPETTKEMEPRGRLSYNR